MSESFPWHSDSVSIPLPDIEWDSLPDGTYIPLSPVPWWRRLWRWATLYEWRLTRFCRKHYPEIRRQLDRQLYRSWLSAR